jgi:hypothetical protein
MSYLDEPERGQILQEALDTARAIRGAEAHARRLTALVPYLAGQDDSQTLREALEVARQATNGELRGILIATHPVTWMRQTRPQYYARI